ncbi:MAG: thiolase domain-containing protein [Archaeoglobaceae archaeon]
MSENVAIIGVGHSKFGTRRDVNIPELAWEAIKPAFETANVEPRDLDFFVVGNAGIWSSEAAVPALLAEYAGLAPKGSMRVEAACATGSAAIRVGYTAIKSGLADLVLVVGIEKMQESPNPTVIEIIGRFGSYFWEFENFGLTFPGYYAMYGTAYMLKYGATEEDYARVAVKNHYYGAKNPYAQFQKEVDVETVMKSPYIAWPFKLYDCSPITDGAAAVILASEEKVKELGSEAVWILGQGVGTGTANLSRRDDFTSLASARYAAEVAYKMAGIDVDDPVKYLDGANVHDCFTAPEIIAYEDLRFCKRGEGVKLIREEQTYIGGKIPVNVDGGLKAKGHPIGATGVSQAVEAYKQLLQKAEPGRQADIRNGRWLTHNIGGTGHFAYVTIYGLEKR